MNGRPHPSDDLLERLIMGVLGSGRAREARGHVDACRDCQARMEALSRASVAYVRERDPQAFARRVLARVEERVRERAPARSWVWFAGLLAPAAAVALLFSLRPVSTAPGIYLGVKGGVKLEAFVRADGGSVRLHDGSVVHPGDALRFAYSAPGPGYAMVVGLDEQGEVFPYFPLNGTASAAVAGGTQVLLPGSVVLDGTLGRERLYLVWTRSPLEVSDVRDAVRAAHTTLAEAQLPVESEQASVEIDKAAPP